MLQDGDIWLSERKRANGEPYQGVYFLQVRVWRKQAWRKNGTSWTLMDLVKKNTEHGLIRIEARPKNAMYTGIYRFEQEEE